MSGAPKWPDLAGRMEGDAHVLPVRVYYEDTDFSGIVYHASYLRYCERGRSDFLRFAGGGHRALHEDQETPAAFVVVRMEIDFVKPGRIDDILEVVTRCAEVTAATMTLDQQVHCADALLVRARVRVALIGENGRPQRLPAPVREALKHFVNDSG